VGTVAHGTLCHKPCTVSGGGKSEISKSIANVLVDGPVFVRNYFPDFAEVERILHKDFSNIYKQPETRARRPILSPDRSLGSVIKLLTASAEYTDEYNAWLRDLPQTIRQLVFTVARYYRPEWGENWREHFTVDRVNGFLGHELKYENQKLVGNYLRMGFDPQGSWRIFKLRPDFHPADKVQVEDDITASVVVPRNSLDDFDPKYPNQSVKLVENCEAFLFQRPDDAIHPGFDKQAESDIASNALPGTRVLSAMTRSYFREPDLYRKRPIVADKHGFLLERVFQRLHGDPGKVVIRANHTSWAFAPDLDLGLNPLGREFLDEGGERLRTSSGSWFGTIRIETLAAALAGITDSKGKILIPGFYKNVKAPTKDELKAWQRLPFNEEH
jgi:hypothetical protein